MMKKIKKEKIIVSVHSRTDSKTVMEIFLAFLPHLAYDESVSEIYI